MAGYLVAGYLGSLLAIWLLATKVVCWLSGLLADFLVSSMTTWLSGWLTEWLVSLLASRLAGLLNS